MNKKKILYDYAMQHVGLPYIWGGDDPMIGYDCSGFAQELLAAIGDDPKGDQTAHMLHAELIKMGGRECNPRFGAMAFYGRPGVKITHVGMCLDEEIMIEAGGGDSRTVSERMAAKQNAYVRVRPVMGRNDFVTCILPPSFVNDLWK